jgi:hypothetical protein
MKWRPHARWPVAAGKLNLSVMAAAFVIFGVSLIFQAGRWGSTPAYHVLLQIFRAQTWGILFLASGTGMGLSAWQFERRWAVTASLMAAFTLTTGWMLAFIVRYLTNPDTTPATWVSWAVFDFLLLNVAISIDRPPAVPANGAGKVSDYRQAVDDALDAAAEDQKTALIAALEADWDKRRDSVSAACAAYAQALNAIIPAGAMPAGDLAKQAIDEARNALLRAQEAYERVSRLPAADAHTAAEATNVT